MGLSLEKPRRPFRRCQTQQGITLATANGSTVRGGLPRLSPGNWWTAIYDGLAVRIGPQPDTSEPSPRKPLRLPPDFYSGHTPRTTCWRNRQRELTPHTQPLPRFVIIIISKLTSLDRVTDRTQRYVSGSRPSIVSDTRLLGCRFRGTETRSVPLPIHCAFSQFGTVFFETHWQALSGLS